VALNLTFANPVCFGDRWRFYYLLHAESSAVVIVAADVISQKSARTRSDSLCRYVHVKIGTKTNRCGCKHCEQLFQWFFAGKNLKTVNGNRQEWCTDQPPLGSRITNDCLDTVNSSRPTWSIASLRQTRYFRSGVDWRSDVLPQVRLDVKSYGQMDRWSFNCVACTQSCIVDPNCWLDLLRVERKPLPSHHLHYNKHETWEWQYIFTTSKFQCLSVINTLPHYSRIYSQLLHSPYSPVCFSQSHHLQQQNN
jgi:hypothetical protein